MFERGALSVICSSSNTNTLEHNLHFALKTQVRLSNLRKHFVKVLTCKNQSDERVETMIQRIKTDGVAMVVSKCPPRVDNVVATSNKISIVLLFDSTSLCMMYVRKDRIQLWDVARLQYLVSKELLKSACNVVDLSGALRCKEDTGMVRASEHPRYRKYFRMLRSLPMQAVAKSMRLAGFDEHILERPDELVTLEDEEEKTPEGLDDVLSRTLCIVLHVLARSSREKVANTRTHQRPNTNT